MIHCSSVFIAAFEQISHFTYVFSLLTLSKFYTSFYYLSCQLWRNFTHLSTVFMFSCRNILHNPISFIVKFNTYLKCLYSQLQKFPPNIILFKVNHWNTRKRSELCSKLSIKTTERRPWYHAVVFIVKSKHISRLVLLFLLLRFHILP